MRLAAFALIMAFGTQARAQELALPEPPVSVELRPATVRFEANIEGLRILYLQDPVLDDADGGLAIRIAPPNRYVELCETPCDRELPQTHLGLAVAHGSRLIRFGTPLGVDGPTGVRLDWQSRDDTRLAGLLLATIGGGAGLGVGIATLLATTDDVELGAGLGAGGALLVGAVIVGIVLALMDDAATFRAAPLPADGGGLFSDSWD